MPPRINKAKAILPSSRVVVPPKDVIFELPECHPSQHDFVYCFENRPGTRFVVAACGSKFGKALSINELVPTPNGWRTMGDLQVGDYVFTEDGIPTRITYATDVMYGHQCYEVRFSDGASVVADAEHEWCTWTDNDKRFYRERRSGRELPRNWSNLEFTIFNPKGQEVGKRVLGTKKTTEEILSTLQDKHCIPYTKPLEFTKKDLPIPPWVFGYMLGDADTKKARVACHKDDRDWLVSEFQRHGVPAYSNQKDDIHFFINGFTKKWVETIGETKSVPRVYLEGSVDQRLELLKGLYDSDGGIVEGKCTFTNTNKDLVEVVKELCSSLGIPHFVQCVAAGNRYGRNCRQSWRVSALTPTLDVFRLPRKLEKLRNFKATTQRAKVQERYITQVNPVPSEPVRCIKVDSPNSLFLVTKACIPTHNTRGAAIRTVKEAWEGFPGKLCWWLAPSYAQSENAYAEVRRMLPKGTFKEEKAKLSLQLVTPSGGEWSRIEYKSADKPDNLRGFGVHFLVVDEMSRIKREAYLSALTTQIKTGGSAMYLSTPRGHDDFYDLFNRGDKSRLASGEVDKYPEYFSFQLPTYLNPYISAESIEQMRNTMLHRDFQQEVEAQFLDDSSAVFRGINECIRGQLSEPVPGKRYVFGADLAINKDFCCVIGVDIEQKQVVYFDHFQGEASWDMVIARISSVSARYNGALVVVDSTAIGDYPSRKIAERTPTIRYSFNTNAAKREVIEKLRLSIEQGKIGFPHIGTLIDELRAYELNVTASGVVQYSAPRGKFDDTVTALALANSQLVEIPWSYKFRRVRL